MKNRACVVSCWLPAFALALALALGAGCDDDGDDQGRERGATKDDASTTARKQDAASEGTRDAGRRQDGGDDDAIRDSGSAVEGADGALPPFEGCVEVATWPDWPGMDGTSYYRTTWDGALRIKTRESSSSADFATQGSTLRWRYSEDGRVLAYAGDDFQHDYTYDEHDNVIDFRLTYPDAPDVTKPSTASVWIGRASENRYDESGRLSSSVETEYGAGVTYPRTRRRSYREENGRCTSIATVNEGDSTTTETREYDERGVLTDVDVRYVDETADHDAGVPLGFCGSSHRTLVYRDGMLESDTTVCSGGGEVSQTYSYLPDGSVKIARYDGLTDVPSESRSTLLRSAACLQIDAAIGAPDARCRVR